MYPCTLVTLFLFSSIGKLFCSFFRLSLVRVYNFVKRGSMSQDPCSYTDCDRCVNGTDACQWDLDLNLCYNSVSRGYSGNNYASNSSQCLDDCCGDNLNCGDCTDVRRCNEYCVWDNDNTQCVDFNSILPSDYTSKSTDCDGHSEAAIVGIVVGVLIAVGFCLCISWFIWYQIRQRKRRRVPVSTFPVSTNINGQTGMHLINVHWKIHTHKNKIYKGNPVAPIQGQSPESSGPTQPALN